MIRCVPKFRSFLYRVGKKVLESQFCRGESRESSGFPLFIYFKSFIDSVLEWNMVQSIPSKGLLRSVFGTRSERIGNGMMRESDTC